MMARSKKIPTQATAVAILAACLVGFLSRPAAADTVMVTECSVIGLCYCVNKDNLTPINANIARVRQLIADQKAQGKAIGYISVPLSTAGGSYFGVNSDVAFRTKDAIEKRLGEHSVWMLNPGAEGNLQGASGADYMYMWTRILEGRNGLGEDFDFFYFIGPSAFRRFFALDGTADMEKIEAYFDDRLTHDPQLQDAVKQNKVSKRTFRDYYALRASVSFSYGSHDEWNIARLINDRRRGATDYGIANQLAIFFDGHPQTPGGYESPTASGDVGRCIK
jgi:hypothetical protein